MSAIIDVHCHIYPDKIARRATVALGGFYDILQPALDGTTDTLTQRGREAGITHFVVDSVATTPAQVSTINRFIAQSACSDPEHIIGLGTLHPDSDDLRRDFEELLRLGLRGVKLHPDVQGFKTDDYRCLMIYEMCEGVCPVLIHCGDFRFDFSSPRRLSAIMSAYDGLTVIGAHFGGWSVWEEAVSELAGTPNLYVDTSSSLPFMDDSRAVSIMDAFGYDRLLFGTDYPMWTAEEELARIRQLISDPKRLEAVLWSNAASLFKIKL